MHGTGGLLSRREFLAAGASSLLLGCASPQQPPAIAQADSSFAPQTGQPGKDVVWVPTPDDMVTRMLQLAGVTAQDTLFDLGSGDGKIVIAAAREFGTRGTGVEFNPDMVALSIRRAAAAGVSDRARFVRGDIFETDFSSATVVTMYLLPNLNMRLRHTLMAMKPGTRIVSHEFGLGDWEPDETSRIRYRSAHLWIVPANAGGEWSVPVPHAKQTRTALLKIEQTFQRIRGVIDFDGFETSIRDARLSGTRIRFAFTDTDGVLRQVDARIDPNEMVGSIAAASRRVAGLPARPLDFVARRLGQAPAIEGSKPAASVQIHG